MESLDNLCLNCMKDKRDATECPFCGHKNTEMNDENLLKAGSVLAERYLVGKSIKSNGEGVTYIGFDTEKSRVVEIREFFPQNLAERNDDGKSVDALENSTVIFKDYLADFVENARSLSRLKNLPAIVKVFDILELNHTAYVIYEHFNESVTLYKAITHNPKKYISWNEAKGLIDPVIRCVAAAHSIGLMHFGISPKTIILTGNGELKITGFGIPEVYICETEIIPSLEEGYAAIEQYSLDGKKGKWTDVYSLSAVLFFMLTGINMPDAIKRSYDPGLNIPKELANSLPTHVLTALAHGLQVQPDSRTRSVEKFGEELFGERPESLSPSAEAVKVNKTEPAKATGFSGNVARHTVTASRTQSTIAAEQKVKEDEKNSIKTIVVSSVITVGVLILVIILAVMILGPDDSNDDISSLPVSSVEITSIPVVSVPDESSQEISNGDIVQYEVPDFTGKTIDYAQRTAGEKFSVVTGTKKFSDIYEEGYIVSQDVEDGTMIQEGATVTVVVSLGSEYRKIPNIVGKEIDAATKLLNDEGLKLGEVETVYSTDVKKDRIIKIIDHEEGDKVKYGTAIDIQISLGKESAE